MISLEMNFSEKTTNQTCQRHHFHHPVIGISSQSLTQKIGVQRRKQYLYVAKYKELKAP